MMSARVESGDLVSLMEKGDRQARVTNLTILETVTGIKGGVAKRARTEAMPLMEDEVQKKGDDLQEVKAAFAQNDIDIDLWMRSMRERKLKDYHQMVGDTKNVGRIIEYAFDYVLE